MRTRLVALCLAAVLAVLVIVPVALANGGHRHMKGKHKFQLNGVVVSTDAAAGTMVVKVKSGTWTVKKFRTMKLPLPLTVSPTARMSDATVDPAVPATLDSFGRRRQGPHRRHDRPRRSGQPGVHGDQAHPAEAACTGPHVVVRHTS